MADPLWLKQFKGTTASFAGVPFTIEEIDMIFGRDLTLLDNKSGGFAAAFGQVDSSDSMQDQGRLPRQIDVTCAFYGSDYIDKRDAFITAIEREGVFSLILPNHDPMNVRAGRAVNRFSNRSGGYERIIVTFVKSEQSADPARASLGASLQPTQTINTSKAAEEGINDSKATFLAAFGTKLESGAKWVADASTKLTENVSDTINNTLGVGAIGDGLEAVTEASNALAQNATTLIYTPTVLANQINDAISALTFAFTQPINAFNAQLGMLENYGLIDSSTGETPTDQDAIDNNNSFVQIVNNIALAEAGRSAVLAEYVSLDDALKAKSRFEAAARAQQLQNGNTTGSDESYREISNIIALVSNHITAQEDLPSNIDISYPDSNPALVVAHDLYADSERGDELVSRNNVQNPLFLPQELTALSF